MKLYLASDHAGFVMKEAVSVWLSELGYDVVDCGAFEYNRDDDYTDFVSIVAREVSLDRESRGVVFGGSGQGEAMCANRFIGIRAAVFYGGRAPLDARDSTGASSHDPLDIVRLSREHNETNILSIGSRFITLDEAREAIRVWLNTEFSGQERYKKRNDQLDTLSL